MCDIGSSVSAFPAVVLDQQAIMPWKMVTKGGVNMSLQEAVEGIKKDEKERKLVSEFEAEHVDEINELQGVIDCMKDERYIREKFPELYKFGLRRLGIHFSNGLALTEYSSDSPSNQGYSQLNYFKKVIKTYEGQDTDADKYVERVRAYTDKPLDELRIEDVSVIMKKKLVKFPCRLEISVFYELTGRLPLEELEFNERDLIVHFYNTFLTASEKLFGKPVRYRVKCIVPFVEEDWQGTQC